MVLRVEPFKAREAGQAIGEGTTLILTLGAYQA